MSDVNDHEPQKVRMLGQKSLVNGIHVPILSRTALFLHRDRQYGCSEVPSHALLASSYDDDVDSYVHVHHDDQYGVRKWDESQ